MNKKIHKDFSLASEYIEENYKKVREIIAFLN